MCWCFSVDIGALCSGGVAEPHRIMAGRQTRVSVGPVEVQVPWYIAAWGIGGLTSEGGEEEDKQDIKDVNSFNYI